MSSQHATMCNGALRATASSAAQRTASDDESDPS